jgi:hypothetical protein
MRRDQEAKKSLLFENVSRFNFTKTELKNLDATLLMRPLEKIETRIPNWRLWQCIQSGAQYY